MLDEESLHYLLALEPGERVIGFQADDLRMGVRVGIEGGDLPEVAPGCDAPRVDRPYAMHRLRDRLSEVMAEAWRVSHSPEEYHKAVADAVEREVWPHLRRPVP